MTAFLSSFKSLPLPEKVREGPLSPEEYHALSCFKRLMYRTKYSEHLAPDMNHGSAASILMAAYAVGTLLASLISGPLSDRLGRRPVLLFAMGIYTLAQFLMANAWDIASFAGFRAMAGISAGTRPVIISFLIDSSRPIDMKLYGVIMGLHVVVGQSIGPAIGGVLATVSLSFPFYFMGVVSAVLFILELLFLRESLEKDESGMPINKFAHPDEKEPPINKYLWPTVVVLGIVSFSAQYVGINWSTVFGLLGADEYNLSSSENGGVQSIQAVGTIFTNLIYLQLTKLIPAALLGSLGLVLTMTIVIVPFIHSLTGVIFLGIGLQAEIGLYFAGQAYFTAVISPPKRRGLINSCVMAASNIGGLVGPLVAGNLYDLNVAYPFYLSVIFSGVGAISCIFVYFGMKHQTNLLEHDNGDSDEGSTCGEPDLSTEDTASSVDLEERV
ncbi:Quinolone resistance protein norA, putative [Perkinsus marinus ATCC 50983]|uniref:Quinolone resistance protein norA, putative n=1 Tax=Perkinsus marinus (strain ATCC 50983 / TXsc) TaxID=423536 RepID=C5KX88_PERM5|nr:Quinolone resistance protein norA, putative [Perkinsus marinus ATCC 50983]EER10944.1 Quinolone resistance protein norA, putative [Perkinsus marinus ATCC 50983]|eukprot:XP_002779149.1 Quinolone resistance protein norA, putative [Perkinsus marinus ATCC 50983]